MAAAKYERGDPREKARAAQVAALCAWLECASCRGKLDHVVIMTRVRVALSSRVAVLALVHGYSRPLPVVPITAMIFEHIYRGSYCCSPHTPQQLTLFPKV